MLSLAWYSTDQEGGGVAARSSSSGATRRCVEKVFSKNPNGRQRGSKAGPRKLDLFAVAVFQNAHYTAFVRATGRTRGRTTTDARPSRSGRSCVVARCRAGPMLPYLLFYGALTTAPGINYCA